MWQEVLEGVRQIKTEGGRRPVVEPRSPIVRARWKTRLTQAQFARLLSVSKRTLEQWEQGRWEGDVPSVPSSDALGPWGLTPPNLIE